MSEYSAVKTQYKDLECLLGALGDVGYAREHVEVHETPQQLIDYRGNPTRYLDKNGDKANVIVRRKYVGGAANDLGFAKQADGTYSAIISAYDFGKHNQKWQDKLKQSYTERVTIKTAAKQGFKYLGKKVVAGKVQLQWLDTRSK